MLRIFSLVSGKVPAEEFEEKIAKFYKNIPFTDHIYGKGFKFLFTDALKWVIDSRFNRQQPKGKTEKDLTLPFPVQRLIKRKVHTLDEVKDILEKEPVKQPPDIRLRTKGKPQAAFVDLEKVVGGTGIENWARINNTPRQALEKITRLAYGLSEGSIDLTGGYDPIEVYKFGGEYYVLQDGRHRIAALKALGVPFAPMIVTPLS